MLGSARNLLPVTLCFPEARNDTSRHRDSESAPCLPKSCPASECVNSEGIKSWHIADGANAAYTAVSGGMEYDAVFPVWDWRKVRCTCAVNCQQ